MVTITKKQFIELRDREDCFQVIKWPWLHQKMLLREFILLAKNAGVDSHDLQFIIWKFDNPWWETAFGGGGSFAKIVDNYLNRRAESDMEVKELVELFEAHNEKHGMPFAWIELFDDEAGAIKNTEKGKVVFEFLDMEELTDYLKTETQKTPDYKSLFSMVDGRLEADFSGIEITEENALLLSIAKWEVICEKLEGGELIEERGRSTCACCKLYDGKPGCLGCPIGRECSDSPYGDYLDACTLFEHMQAAYAEVEFLKSLMEKKK